MCFPVRPKKTVLHKTHKMQTKCFYKGKSKVFDPITRSLSKDKDISMQMFIIVLFIMVRN